MDAKRRVKYRNQELLSKKKQVSRILHTAFGIFLIFSGALTFAYYHVAPRTKAVQLVFGDNDLNTYWESSEYKMKASQKWYPLLSMEENDTAVSDSQIN